MNNKDNFIDELNIKNLCIGTNIKYDVDNVGTTNSLTKVNGKVIWYPIYNSYYGDNIEINIFL